MRAAGGAVAVGAVGRASHGSARASALALRHPDTLPDPSRPAGEPTAAFPFDHIVCVMQENHSFDNYFGMLPRRGQPPADGFAFDRHGVPINTNPLGGGDGPRAARAERVPADRRQPGVDADTPADRPRPDGRIRPRRPGQMVYYDEPDIPFYYSLANTFCVGNRWFCSAPCQTYPNRRFYLAARRSG